jgi:acyl-CoA thioester hydrolase
MHRQLVAHEAGTPRPEIATISVDGEVPFHHVDAMGIVWHGHYYKYLELAFTAFLRSRGLDLDSIRALGFALVVIESKCRHSFPLRYGDRVRVTARPGDVDNRVRMLFEVTNLTRGRRSARAHITLVTTLLDGTMLYETPSVIRERLQGQAR